MSNQGKRKVYLEKLQIPYSSDRFDRSWFRHWNGYGRKKATVLKPFGDIFLNLMFTAIVPLVFATIASAVGNMMNMKRLGSILGNMFLVFVITGIIAGIVIITAVTICPPAQGVDIAMEAVGDMEAVKLSDAIVNAITVNDFFCYLIT